MYHLVLVLTLLADLAGWIRAGVRRRVRLLRERPEAGYSTEAVVITALLVAGAITAVGLIVAKVTAKARSIDLGP
jgi:hypothetical protein